MLCLLDAEGGGAVIEAPYALASKASRRSSIASWDIYINLEIGKKCGMANLNLPLKSLNSPLEAVEPPG